MKQDEAKRGKFWKHLNKIIKISHFVSRKFGGIIKKLSEVWFVIAEHLKNKGFFEGSALLESEILKTIVDVMFYRTDQGSPTREASLLRQGPWPLAAHLAPPMRWTGFLQLRFSTLRFGLSDIYGMRAQQADSSTGMTAKPSLDHKLWKCVVPMNDLTLFEVHWQR